MLKKIATVVTLLVMSGFFNVLADVLKIRDDAPASYVVQKGDTLWDISALYLNEPWLWPQLWQMNPQVDNPHLIYPGDTLTLTYDAQGKPRLMVNDNVKRLSPTARKTMKGGDAISTLPLAVVGGIWTLWLLDFNLSVAVGVGFIALAGVAAEFGVIMLLYLKNAWAEREDAGDSSEQALVAAIREGAVQRVRPKAMTVAVIIAGLLPILLGGDHSLSMGSVSGMARYAAELGRPLYVLWLDAHSDFNAPETSPSGNIHGMPIAAALGLDHLHLAKNELDAATTAYWNNLKSTAFLPQDLIYIGVRDTEAEEDAIMAELQLKNYTVAELRQKGLNNCLAEMHTQLAACDLIYVSFDVDSIDPIETSYGTGTPVPNGISFTEAQALLNHFAADPKLCALEIVEVNPCLDDEKNKMAERTLDLIENIITQLS